MKQQQPNPINRHHGKHVWNPIRLVVTNLKTLLAGSWAALGNFLLLIGGDDSVEFGITPPAIHLINEPPLSINSDEGHGA
jgi:hypothetical protein